MLIDDLDALPENGVIIFNHLPKVGGTSLIRFFRRLFGPERCLRCPGGLAANTVSPPIDALSDKELRRLRFFAGHFAIGSAERFERMGKAAYYLGVVRDPLERARSSYHYGRTHISPERRERLAGVSFEQHLKQILNKREHPYVNGQIRALTGYVDLDHAKRIIETRYFALCGTEQLDELQRRLAVFFGQAEMAPVRIHETPRSSPADASAEVERRFIEANALDAALHRWVVAKFGGV